VRLRRAGNSEFDGFSKQCVRFFTDLKVNNNKIWFEQHRSEYDTYVLQPARAFVVALGERLTQISPGVVADPRTNKSLFRIHRDTRFSPDKSPYKLYMAIRFWEGMDPKMSPCYYFHLEPNKILLAAGLYRFPKEHLAEFRKSVVHPKHGPALVQAMESVRENGKFDIEYKHYKRVPRGFDPEHELAEYLLYGGLTAHVWLDIPKAFYSSDLVDFCFERYEQMAPLHMWLVGMTERL